ncbi:hypothetical protein [Zoogloea sp.]|uniref:hypothetical protein n=1 Tax=Zoogloea sp. TaxID=49181 RepID=UPI0037DA1D00
MNLIPRSLLWVATGLACLAGQSIQNAIACPPSPGPAKPWAEVVKGAYQYAESVFIGTAAELQKIPSDRGPNRLVDQIHFSEMEALKGEPGTDSVVETENIDGLPRGCGFSLRVGIRYLIMARGKNLTMALPMDESGNGYDIAETIKIIRNFSSNEKPKP